NSPFSCRLRDHCSIYTAELQAILLALKQAYQSQESKFMIFSDSLSALQALGKLKTDHPLLIQIQEFLHKINADQKEIVFMWVPGHVGIRGNEAADRAAKKALDNKPTADLMPFSDLKPLTAKYVYQVWQKEWDETGLVSNKFHEILPKLGDKLLSFCNTRKENTVLNRLHIGHSYLTHSFILRREEAPVCVACNVVLTVKHILIECADLLEIRKKYFEEKSLYSLFRNVIPEVIFDFLREIGVFYKV
ncbi:ribonuclease H family protein, partial [Thiolapillus sp.]